MTREEAAIIIGNIPINEGDDCYTIAEYQEAKAMAIKELNQVEVLDKIRPEITAIAINGQVDEHTAFIRTGEQVKQMALDIIDKYKAESEVSE